MIKLYPQFGLCNRLRAIDSALSLAADAGQSLEIFWVQNADLNSPFSGLFEPIKGVKVIEVKKDLNLFKIARMRNLYLPNLVRSLNGVKGRFYDTSQTKKLGDKQHHFEEVKQSKDFWISGFTRFYNNTEMYKAFVPLPHIQQQIDEETKLFNKYTLGVHIRQTDNAKAIANSPVDLFVETMKAEIEKEPLTNFYLASDSLEVKKQLSEIFGDKLITNFNVVSRTDAEGMERAVVELYTLSRTQKVFGSFWSSFSHTACHIGGIPEVTVKV